MGRGLVGAGVSALARGAAKDRHQPTPLALRQDRRPALLLHARPRRPPPSVMKENPDVTEDRVLSEIGILFVEGFETTGERAAAAGAAGWAASLPRLERLRGPGRAG
jgi:hypothetical protein